MYRWLQSVHGKILVFLLQLSLIKIPWPAQQCLILTVACFFPPFYFLWSCCSLLISCIFNILPQFSCFPHSIRIFWVLLSLPSTANTKGFLMLISNKNHNSATYFHYFLKRPQTNTETRNKKILFHSTSLGNYIIHLLKTK